MLQLVSVSIFLGSTEVTIRSQFICQCILRIKYLIGVKEGSQTPPCDKEF